MRREGKVVVDADHAYWAAQHRYLNRLLQKGVWRCAKKLIA